MYTDRVKELFLNPKHAGEIGDASGIGEVGNPACGDIMRVFIKVENGIIKRITFRTFGCAAAIASSEALCELAEGRHVDEAKKITRKDIVDFLGELPPIKFHCSVLGEEALKKAIEDYEKKKGG